MSEVESDPQESKAREFGWVPKEEWTESGKSADDWVDAQTFNIRGQFIGDLKERDQKIRELESRVSSFGELMVEEKRRAREIGVREAEERHAKAVEEGDTAGAKKALDDVRELERTESVPTGDPVKAFFDSNPEFLDDPDLFAEFDRYDRMLGMRKGGVTQDNITAHLNEVAAAVREKHEPTVATTESTKGRTVGKKKSKPTRADLPEHLQSTHDAFVKQGVMKSEEYIQGLIEVGEIQWP